MDLVNALLASTPLVGNLDVHIVAETLLVGVILFLLLQKSYKPKRHSDKLTDKEVDALCKEWQPEPLVPENAAPLPHVPVVSDMRDGKITVDSKKAVNLGTFDFLSMLGSKRVQEACEATLAKYGCGSCGPRGFYGTIDVHLNLEKEIASFLGTEHAIIYSYDIATISSVIPAFTNRGDLILHDEEVFYPIQQGLYLSRSVTRAFKHNDMEDLERLMKAVQEQDLKQKGKFVLNRRFVAIEGVYARTGTLSPLKAVVALCKKYKYRLILDESISFGTLGATGRGATEHWGVNVKDVDMITASMSNSLASIGGFCAGSEQIVDHQRLSGLGYCFSASLPPFNAVAASTALALINDNSSKVKSLQKNAKAVLETLIAQVEAANKTHGPVVTVAGAAGSCIFHLHLAGARRSSSRVEDEALLHEAAQVALDKHGVAVAVTAASPLEQGPQPPSLRVSCNSAHTEEEARKSAAAIVQALVSVVTSH